MGSLDTRAFILAPAKSSPGQWHDFNAASKCLMDYYTLKC